eukprot:5928443-Alexandrium_andersonii.AAC.1
MQSLVHGCTKSCQVQSWIRCMPSRGPVVALRRWSIQCVPKVPVGGVRDERLPYLKLVHFGGRIALITC